MKFGSEDRYAKGNPKIRIDQDSTLLDFPSFDRLNQHLDTRSSIKLKMSFFSMTGTGLHCVLLAASHWKQAIQVLLQVRFRMRSIEPL